MRLSALPPYPVPSRFTNNYVPNQPKPSFRNRIFRRVACNSGRSESTQVTGTSYKPWVFDDVFLNVFRAKMVKVRVLVSLFPSWLLELYKKLIAPLGGGQVAAVMVARVTAITCQWLMGRCTINSVDLDNGSSWQSGVYVEKCKYLEESKCVGICINTCKLPTQAFFSDYMGVPLLMEPNFSDYSCQFKFGVAAPLPQQDSALKEPCLAICPNALRRREVNRDALQCPKA